MKISIYNKQSLETCIKQIQYDFDKFGSLNIEWEKMSKPTTNKQLGFFFGGLVDSVYDFFAECGYDDISKDDIKWLMYSKASKEIYIPGTMKKRYMTISDMNREDMSTFIDNCIKIIDYDDVFEGLILHPSLRYCWINNLTLDDIRNIDHSKLKRKDSVYLEHTRGEACLLCGKMFESEAHHLKEAGESGVGYKSDDYLSIPLCQKHHKEYHDMGKKEFEESLSWILKKISLEQFCAIRYLRWLNKD